MNLNLTLYTNMFPSDGQHLISASVAIWDKCDLIGLHGVPVYNRIEDAFSCAMQALSVMNDVRSTMQKLGHDVTVAEYFSGSTLVLDAELEKRIEAYKATLPAAPLVDVAELEDAE